MGRHNFFLVKINTLICETYIHLHCETPLFVKHHYLKNTVCSYSVMLVSHYVTLYHKSVKLLFVLLLVLLLVPSYIAASLRATPNTKIYVAAFLRATPGTQTY